MVRSNTPELKSLDTAWNYVWGGPSATSDSQQYGWLLNVPTAGNGSDNVIGKKYFTKSMLARITFLMPNASTQSGAISTPQQAMVTFRISFIWDKNPQGRVPLGSSLGPGPLTTKTDVFQDDFYGSGNPTVRDPLNLALRDRIQILGDDVVTLTYNGQAAQQYERYIKINKESLLLASPTEPNQWSDIQQGSLYVLITADLLGSKWLEGEGPVTRAIFRTRFTDA